MLMFCTIAERHYASFLCSSAYLICLKTVLLMEIDVLYRLSERKAPKKGLNCCTPHALKVIWLKVLLARADASDLTLAKNGP